MLSQQYLLNRFYFAAWIGSIALGLSYFAAPVAGRLSDRFGCRLITIFGSLICALGLVITSFARSIGHLFFSYSLLFGLGAACVRTCTYLVAAKYTYRHRSLATGFVSSGIGVGMLMYGPLVQELLVSIGLQNTYRALTGFALFVGLLASTFSSNVEEENFNEEHDSQIGKAEQTEENQAPVSQRRKVFDCTAWKMPAFTIVTIANAVSALGDNVPQIHLVRQQPQRLTPYNGLHWEAPPEWVPFSGWGYVEG